MLKSLLSVFIFSIFFLPAYAQNAAIKGSVVDTIDKKNLSNSSVILINSKDSILVKDTRTKTNGEFEFANLKKGDYTLIITYPRMADYIRDIRLSDTSKFNLGKIPMDSKATLLNEVVIKAQKQAISMRGDTVIFQADSFAVKPHANVQELLRRLPGIEVDKNGAIKAGGKEVNTLLVDGEEFFGDDPLLAAKYLKANAVSEVQVYDKKTKNEELTGIAEGDSKEKVVNIKLKENAKNGYLSTLDANSDLDHFKNVGGMAGIYKGKLKTAVFGFNTNLNQDSKVRAAIGKLKGNDYDAIEVSDDGSIMINITSGDDDYFSPTNGLPDVTNYGAHFSDKWNENKASLKFNYKGNIRNVLDRNTYKNQSLLPNGINFFSQGGSNSNNRSTGQSLNTNVEFKLDSSATLKVSFAGNNNKNNNENISTNETRNGTGALVNNSEQVNTSNGSSNLFNGNINYSKKFAKRGRTLSVDLQPETKSSSNTGNSISTTNYYEGSIVRQDKLNYLNDNSGRETSFATRVSYTEPLAKKLLLQTAYSFKTVGSNSHRLVFDSALNNKQIDSLSNNFDFNNFSNIGKAILQYRNKKISISGGMEATRTTFELNDLDKKNQFTRNYLNWAPQTNFNYKAGKNTTFSIGYNGNTRQPSLEQLQPLRQVNNPLYQVVGNPDLKPSFNNNINFNFNTYQQKSEMYMYAYISYNFTRNAIVNTRTVDEFNKTVSSYINLNGVTSLYGSANLNKSFNKLHLSTSMGLNYSRSNSPSIINKQLYNNITNRLSINPRISYYTSIFQFEYTPSFTFSNSKSSLGTINDGKNFSHNHEIDGTISLPYNTEFNTSVSLSYQPANASFSTPVNVAIWNASLSKKMLKAEELQLKLSVSDILAQKIGYSRYVGGNNISENTYSFIPRYVLIGITYNLTGNFIKEDKK